MRKLVVVSVIVLGLDMVVVVEMVVVAVAVGDIASEFIDFPWLPFELPTLLKRLFTAQYYSSHNLDARTGMQHVQPAAAHHSGDSDW